MNAGTSTCFSFFVLVVLALASTAVAQEDELVGLEFRYFDHPEDPNTAAGTPGSNVIDSNDVALPYCTIVLNFSRQLSAAEIDAFEDEITGFDVMVDEQGAPPSRLDRLDEVVEAVTGLAGVMSPSGPHSSFFWTEQKTANDCENLLPGEEACHTQLRFQPHGLDGGLSCSLAMPDGFAIDGSATFTTRPFSGEDVRIYEVIVPDEANWREVTIEGPPNTKDPVSCVFLDRFATETNLVAYSGVRIGIRGNTTVGLKQKRYTLNFSAASRFRGFKGGAGAGEQRDKFVLISPVQNANGGLSSLMRYKIGLDTYRALEARDFGGLSLTARNYFSHAVINGRYWGLYLLAEHMSTGNGGMSTVEGRGAADGALALDTDAIIHKGDGSFGLTLGDPPDEIHLPDVEPRTDFTIGLVEDTGIPAQQVETHTLPFPVFGRPSGVGLEPAFLEFKVEAVDTTGADMVLTPVVQSATFAQSELFGGNYFDVVPLQLIEANGTLVPAGQIQDLGTATPIVSVFFPRDIPADNGDFTLEVEMRTPHDYFLLADSVESDLDSIQNWFDAASTFRHMFFIKWSGATDNICHNVYYLMNVAEGDPELDGDADLLSNVLNDPANAALPRFPYHTLMWDLDFSFFGNPSGPIITTFRPPFQNAIPPQWSSFMGEPGEPKTPDQKAYADQFIREFEGGVLTQSFYSVVTSEIEDALGDDLVLHDERWGQTLSPTFFDDFVNGDFIPPLLRDRDWMIRFLLSLREGDPVQPSFIRGDADLNAAVEEADAINLLDFLFNNEEGRADRCLIQDACDVDNGGSVDITDAIRILNFVNRGGPPPEAPFPAKGDDDSDPVPDGLDWAPAPQ